MSRLLPCRANGFNFCSASTLSWLPVSLIWEEKVSLFLSAYLVFPRRSAGLPPSSSLPLFQPLSLWQSQVICYSLLCKAWAPHSRWRGHDSTGVTLKTATSQAGRQAEDQKVALVTIATPFLLHTTNWRGTEKRWNSLSGLKYNRTIGAT